MDRTLDIPTEHLPLWMRQARQSVDWGILVVVVLSAIAAWPFMLQEGVPRTNAAENHVFMAADYATALREGELYPRWSAAAVDGYGAPIPSYTPPGLPYVTAATELLVVPDSTPTALRLVMIGAFGLMGGLTYVFVLRVAGAGAAIMTALLVVFSPYAGVNAPHILGDYPAVLAMALTPGLLWGISRVLRLNHPLDFVTVVLTTGGLLLVHPRWLMALLPLALILVAWEWRGGAPARRVILALLAGGMGVGLVTFFWMPALLEADHIRWMAPAYETLTHRLNFPRIIEPMTVIDLNELVILPQLTIGLGLLLTSVAGAVAIALNRRAGRYGRRTTLHLLFLLAGVGLLAIGLALPEEIWLLGPASFSLAVGASAVVTLRDELPPELKRLIVPACALLILLATAEVWLAPRWSGPFGDATQAGQIAYEQQGYGVAVLPPGSPVPVTLPDDVEPNRALVTGYLDGTPIRLPNPRPVGDRLANLIQAGTHTDRYLVTAEQPTTFDLLRAYAPGWQATLAGEPLPLQPDPATGLMLLPVPETTEATLTVSYDDTPLRDRAWLLSGMTLTVLIAWTVFRLLRMEPSRGYDDLRYLTTPEARLLGIICAGFMLTLAIAVVPDAPLSLYARPGSALDDYVEMRNRTDTGLELLAYQIDAGSRSVSAQEPVRFTLAWRTLRPLLANYSVRVYLRDERRGLRWRLSDPRYPGGYPTRRWTPNRFVRDPHAILPLDALPGDYRIAVEVYICDPRCLPDNRVTFFDTSGAAIGQTLLLPETITVR